jgi:hypothetical protein
VRSEDGSCLSGRLTSLGEVWRGAKLARIEQHARCWVRRSALEQTALQRYIDSYCKGYLYILFLFFNLRKQQQHNDEFVSNIIEYPRK